MRAGVRFNNDLVIGMTLAEVFLLLLIVGWYGSRVEILKNISDSFPPPPNLSNELRQAELARKKAEQERQQLEIKIAEYEKLLDWLGASLGYPQPILDITGA